MSIGDDNSAGAGDNGTSAGVGAPTATWLNNMAKSQRDSAAALLNHSIALRKHENNTATLIQLAANHGVEVDVSSPNPTMQRGRGISPIDVMQHEHDDTQQRVSINNNPNQTRSNSSSDDGKQSQLPPPPSLHRFQDNPPKGFGVADPTASSKAPKSSPEEGVGGEGENVSIFICLCYHLMLFFIFIDINSLHLRVLSLCI